MFKILILLFLKVYGLEVLNINNGIENFLVNQISFYIEKKDNFINAGSYNIPSDLLDALYDRGNFFFEIVINQGRVKNTSIIKKGEQSFSNRNSIYHYPNGYLFHTNDINDLKNIIDLFSNIFKITKNPLLEKTGYIEYDNNYLIIENFEKPCTDHLDAIKEILPYHMWEDFTKKINYDDFSNSDFKSVKIHIRKEKDDSKINFEINITYKNYSKKAQKNNSIIQLEDITSTRFFKGDHYGFENLLYIHEIDLPNDIDTIIIHDIIPIQLDLIYSSIKITGCNNKTISITEKSETQNNIVPFTYEGKKNTHVMFKLNEIMTNKITITYELRKKLLNFESYENESEFGYKFPVGLISTSDRIILTKHIYYNMPFIDGTMPFNVIALSWVVYGFIFIQMLNLFLGDFHAKGILETIKDRLIAKWGFLFGK